MTSSLPVNLYRAEQVRELDRLVIEQGQIPGIELMERAGSAAFTTLQSLWPETRQMAVICGGGNNGGDGYVIARLAHEAGYQVRCLYVKPLEQLQGDAKTAAERAKQAGVVIDTYVRPEQEELVVDAILGTGLDRPVAGELAGVLEELNALQAQVFAIDIPSGLNADTGEVMGVAIQAQATSSFIGLKQGMFTGQGPTCCGQIHFSDLGAPTDILESLTPSACLLDFQQLEALLAPRLPGVHKGHFGHVLVVGGLPGFSGAIRMAAEAAGRVGAGLVSVATDPGHAPLISLAVPELMAHGVGRPTDLGPLIEKCSVIAIGPGLGQTKWSQGLLARVLESSLPLVVDADALNLLAADPVYHDRWIITPHPGEAGRLLGISTREVQSDRFSAVLELQQRYGGVAVLKGNGTLIADQDGTVSVCPYGNPGMATGGMGDVLTGVLAGLLAQGLELADAARLGVCCHGLAGDAAALDGERGMLATDLMVELRRLVNP